MKGREIMITSMERLPSRWEYPAENFLAMLHLACDLILLKHL
jgi:hypothetical protein